jgi:hypothetical protein
LIYSSSVLVAVVAPMLVLVAVVALIIKTTSRLHQERAHRSTLSREQVGAQRFTLKTTQISVDLLQALAQQEHSRV